MHRSIHFTGCFLGCLLHWITGWRQRIPPGTDNLPLSPLQLVGSFSVTSVAHQQFFAACIARREANGRVRDQKGSQRTLPRDRIAGSSSTFPILATSKADQREAGRSFGCEMGVASQQRNSQSGAGWGAQTNSHGGFGALVFRCSKRQVFIAALLATQRDGIISRIKGNILTCGMFSFAGDWSPSRLLYLPVSAVHWTGKLPDFLVYLLSC